MGRKPKHDAPTSLPSREALLAFIAANPDASDKRAIVRHFKLGPAARVALKRLLKDVAEEGLVTRGRGRMVKAGQIPTVVVAAIQGRDRDGELVAMPIEWDEETLGEPPEIVVDTPHRPRPGDIVPGVGDRVLLRIVEGPDANDPRPTGRVMKRLEKAAQRVIGVFRAISGHGGRLVPIEKKAQGREFPIPQEACGGAQDGDVVAVEMTHSPRFGPPLARVVERLGNLKTERAVSLIAIHAHAIPHIFRADALKEADAARPASLNGREDWRDLGLVTIDPPDAKDHDDAVHAAPDPAEDNPGGFIVSVAIADVGAYVRTGSALDREAATRGNSVYFPDRVVPMLPERISNDLCSLKPAVDRPAVALRARIRADGRRLSHSFHRILMRSEAKIAYAEAQRAVEGERGVVPEAVIETRLKPLYAAYAALKRARDDREPLDLDLPERKILLKPDGTVDRVVIPERLDAHRLIEEMMILANVCAAETLEKKRVACMYRIHDAPSLDKLSALREFLKTLDIALPKADVVRPSHFNRVLGMAAGSESAELVNQVILRSQSQAEYSPENIGHFGLNLQRYAHFTSPIRRYADLLVHRALVRALDLGPDGLTDAEASAMAATAAEISAAERRAMAAERETVDRLIAAHLVDRVGDIFEARISGVTRAGLFVKLAETGADGFIPAATIGGEFFRYEEGAQALIGSRSGTGYRLGDKVTARLVEAAPVAGALRFEIMSDGRTGLARAVRFAQKSPRGRDVGSGDGPDAGSRRTRRPGAVRAASKKRPAKGHRR